MKMLRIVLALVLAFVALVSTAAAQVAISIPESHRPVLYTAPLPPENVVISGQVLSKGLGGDEFPLSSESEWGVYVTLSKLSDGELLYTNSTNCYDGWEGCADQFGNFSFTVDTYGCKLTPGVYELETTADGHIVDRQVFKVVEAQVTVQQKLALASALLRLREWPEDIPMGGGFLTAKLWAWSLNGSVRTIPASVMLIGPSSVGPARQTEIVLPNVPVPEGTWTRQEVEMSVYVSGPAGHRFCGEFRIGALGEHVSSIFVCAKVNLPATIVGGGSGSGPGPGGPDEGYTGPPATTNKGVIKK